MNSVYIAIFTFIACFLGYKFYGDFIARLFDIDYNKITPAHKHRDNVDYIPANHWTILFGHHFASIAGAGPILGPVIAAALWGWVPALIWLVLGSIFLGAVHDFSSLIASLRHKGKSIAAVAESTLGYRTKLIFAAFLWLTLILVIAVFAAVAADTLATKPEVVIPTFGIIVVALLVGFLIYYLKVNQILATVIGIGSLFLLIMAGYKYPVVVNPFHIGSFLIEPSQFWLIILLVYAYIASVMPVNILLQPRDYLSTFVLFFGLLLGYVGLFISRPDISTPAFVAWDSSKGWLWPMLFVIVACGAISGFHSLIASGTTAKQLASKRDAKKIGYGGMILESVLAVLALLCVTAGLKWKGAGLNLNYPELLSKEGWIITFGAGFGQIVSPLIKASLGTLIAITILKTFIMTTLDSATRITRYLSEELFADGLKLKIFYNKYFNTLVIVLVSAWLAFGRYRNIWPVFGAANQLVAALVLIVISAYLFSLNKPKRYTLIPAVFMLATTIGALLFLLKDFYKKKLVLLFSVDILLLVLVVFMISEAIKYIRRKELKVNV